MRADVLDWLRMFRTVNDMNARRTDPTLTADEVIARLAALHVGRPENGLVRIAKAGQVAAQPDGYGEDAELICACLCGQCTTPEPDDACVCPFGCNCDEHLA